MFTEIVRVRGGGANERSFCNGFRHELLGFASSHTMAPIAPRAAGSTPTQPKCNHASADLNRNGCQLKLKTQKLPGFEMFAIV